MAKQNHVPDGCYLTCNKGTLPCRLQVTHHHNVRIYGDNLASEADLVPGQNVFPMGLCAVTQQPCLPQPLYWDKTTQGITVNGHKLLVEDAQLQCAVGGQVSIHFSRADALRAVDFAAGLGLGAAEALRRLEGRPFGLLPGVAAEPRAALRGMGGQFGENYLANYRATDAMLPTEQLRWSQKTARRTFTDGRPMEGGRDAVLLRGQNSRGTLPPAEVVRMPDGGYTTLDNRRAVTAIEGGATEIPVVVHEGQAPVPPEEAERFTLTEKHKPAIKRLNAEAGGQPYQVGSRPATYEEAARFRSATQGSTFPLAGSPDRPRISGDPPPGGEVGRLAPPSRTTQFLASVSESVQSRPGIARANDFMVRNAESISRVGKVAGRSLIVLGIAVDAYRLSQAYEADGNQVGQQTLETAGSAVGGFAGAWAGAEVGATIGLVGGPVGVVVGGLVGGAIGGVLGSAAGQGLVHGVGEFLGSW